MPRILVADDDVSINEILKETFSSRGYEVVSAYDGVAALKLYEECQPHIILLDIRMPGLTGLEVLREIRKRDSSVGVIMVTGSYDDQMIEESLKLGAFDFITKPFRLSHIENTVMNRISDILKNSEEKLKASYEKLKEILNSTIESMARIVETRDPYTAGHQERVAYLSEAISGQMALPEDQIRSIKIAAMLHDLGKIYVPAEILAMPRKLSSKEFEIIKEHPQVAFEVLRSIDFEYPIGEFVLQHHERLNGFGYPRGISGNSICLEARIIAVADTVEAMSSFRPYRPEIGLPQALSEITLNRDVLYDPEVVDACTYVFDHGFSFKNFKQRLGKQG